MTDFLKKNFSRLLWLLAIGWLLFYSFFYLTTKPRLWTDEGINIELARNFSLTGHLDVSVQPGVLSGYQYLLQATGYPITVPLAAFFKIFGFGLVQARVYMIIWLLIFCLTAWWLARRLFGSACAAIVLALLVTFAPFYGNGRCVIGDIPGAVFLLAAIYFLFYRHRFWLGGGWLGLAVVCKPSLYVMAALAAVVVLFFDGPGRFKKICQTFFGALPAGFLWLTFNLPDFLAADKWSALIKYYKNPFGDVSPWSNIKSNLALWHYPTIFYFLFLLAALTLVAVLKKNFYQKHQKLWRFILLYGLLSLFYFLKSPGWLRYLIAAQLLVIIAFVPSLAIINDRLRRLSSRLGRVNWFYLLAIGLILFQLTHLLFWAKLFYSDQYSLLNKFIDRQSSNQTIGVINSPAIASLIDPARKFQVVEMLGLPVLGRNPLLLAENRLPDFIVASCDELLLLERLDKIQEYYQLVNQESKFCVYHLE